MLFIWLVNCLGNQVINWGSSELARGGLRFSTPFNSNLLRTPNTTLLTEFTWLNNLTVSGHYKFNWNANQYAPSGAYHSFTDFGLGSNAVEDRLSSNSPALASATRSYDEMIGDPESDVFGLCEY